MRTSAANLPPPEMALLVRGLGRFPPAEGAFAFLPREAGARRQALLEPFFVGRPAYAIAIDSSDETLPLAAFIAIGPASQLNAAWPLDAGGGQRLGSISAPRSLASMSTGPFTERPRRQ